MATRDDWLPTVGRRDVGFGVAVLVSLVLVLPAQFASMVLFDSTGLDTVVPSIVFMAPVPAAVLALVPAAIAARFYARRRALLVAGGTFLGYLLVTAYLAQFYGVCGGPGC